MPSGTHRVRRVPPEGDFAFRGLPQDGLPIRDDGLPIQDVSNPVGQLLGGEGLLQEPGSGGEQSLSDQILIGVPGHVEDPDTGPDLSYPGRHLDTVHPGHHDIGEKEIDLLIMLPSYAQGLLTPLGRKDRVAETAQSAPGDSPNRSVILHQEDGLGAPGTLQVEGRSTIGWLGAQGTDSRSGWQIVITDRHWVAILPTEDAGVDAFPAAGNADG